MTGEHCTYGVHIKALLENNEVSYKFLRDYTGVFQHD